MEIKESVIVKSCIPVLIFVILVLSQTISISSYGEHDHEHDHDVIEVDTGVPADRLWCNEHSVYEDECFICHPELEHKSSEDVSEALFCIEHDMMENECGICHPELAEHLKPGKSLKIRLNSKESAGKAGLITALPEKGLPFTVPSVLCQVKYNENRLAHITPITLGVVRNVLVDVGAYVSEDDVLVEIASPGITKAKAEYLTALADETLKELVYEREKGLFDKKVSSQHEYQQAMAEYQIAVTLTGTTHQQLLNFGFTEPEVQEIAKNRLSTSILPVRAPFSGTIIDRHAVIGESVETGAAIFSLADLSTMWLELLIPEGSFASFKVGNRIEATFKNIPEMKLHGELIWLASKVEPDSRMLKARAVIKNMDLILKHGMFGQVSLLPDASDKGLYLHPDSIQRYEGKDFVFVMLSDDLYEIRRVIPGTKNKEKVEIIEGISMKDKVVVKGSFTLKSEFLKSRMGAGCVHE